jgi:VIT1/CCC1 family predicted Fe2+/Mn2+ transporter
MTNFPDAISVLSAMITPAVLISACGSLILATSDRLSKAVNRTREISTALMPRAATEQRADGREEERRMLFVQLDYATTRSRLLQRALSRLYAALGFFVGTSVAIGLVAVTDSSFTIVPVVLGLSGAGLLLYAAFLLIKESRFALAAVNDEMDFVWKRGKEYGPPDLVERGMKRTTWLGKIK